MSQWKKKPGLNQTQYQTLHFTFADTKRLIFLLFFRLDVRLCFCWFIFKFITLHNSFLRQQQTRQSWMGHHYVPIHSPHETWFCLTRKLLIQRKASDYFLGFYLIFTDGLLGLHLLDKTYIAGTWLLSRGVATDRVLGAGSNQEVQIVITFLYHNYERGIKESNVSLSW